MKSIFASVEYINNTPVFKIKEENADSVFVEYKLNQYQFSLVKMFGKSPEFYYMPEEEKFSDLQKGDLIQYRNLVFKDGANYYSKWKKNVFGVNSSKKNFWIQSSLDSVTGRSITVFLKNAKNLRVEFNGSTFSLEKKSEAVWVLDDDNINNVKGRLKLKIHYEKNGVNQSSSWHYVSFKKRRMDSKIHMQFDQRKLNTYQLSEFSSYLNNKEMLEELEVISNNGSTTLDKYIESALLQIEISSRIKEDDLFLDTIVEQLVSDKFSNKVTLGIIRNIGRYKIIQPEKTIEIENKMLKKNKEKAFDEDSHNKSLQEFRYPQKSTLDYLFYEVGLGNGENAWVSLYPIIESIVRNNSELYNYVLPKLKRMYPKNVRAVKVFELFGDDLYLNIFESLQKTKMNDFLNIALNVKLNKEFLNEILLRFSTFEIEDRRLDYFVFNNQSLIEKKIEDSSIFQKKYFEILEKKCWLFKTNDFQIFVEEQKRVDENLKAYLKKYQKTCNLKQGKSNE